MTYRITKAAVSVGLAALLVVQAATQVLAQAVPPEAVGVHTMTAPDDAAHRLAVPPLTENTALLWSTSSDWMLLNADASLVQEGPGGLDGLNWAARGGLVVAAGVVSGAVMDGLIARAADSDYTILEGAGIVAAFGAGLGVVVFLFDSVHQYCKTRDCRLGN